MCYLSLAATNESVYFIHDVHGQKSQPIYYYGCVVFFKCCCCCCYILMLFQTQSTHATHLIYTCHIHSQRIKNKLTTSVFNLLDIYVLDGSLLARYGINNNQNKRVKDLKREVGKGSQWQTDLNMIVVVVFSCSWSKWY